MLNVMLLGPNLSSEQKTGDGRVHASLNKTERRVLIFCLTGQWSARKTWIEFVNAPDNALELKDLQPVPSEADRSAAQIG
jgi:hypothetical protein